MWALCVAVDRTVAVLIDRVVVTEVGECVIVAHTGDVAKLTVAASPFCLLRRQTDCQWSVSNPTTTLPFVISHVT